MSAENGNELYVDVDWGSTGLWVNVEGRGYCNCSSYDGFGLPDSLVERFRYWTGCFNNEVPSQAETTRDQEAFEACGYALAIDLKRVVGDRYRVICVHRDWQEIFLPNQALIRESTAPDKSTQVLGHPGGMPGYWPVVERVPEREPPDPALPPTRMRPGSGGGSPAASPGRNSPRLLFVSFRVFRGLSIPEFGFRQRFPGRPTPTAAGCIKIHRTSIPDRELCPAAQETPFPDRELCPAARETPFPDRELCPAALETSFSDRELCPAALKTPFPDRELCPATRETPFPDPATRLRADCGKTPRRATPSTHAPHKYFNKRPGNR